MTTVAGWWRNSRSSRFARTPSDRATCTVLWARRERCNGTPNRVSDNGERQPQMMTPPELRATASLAGVFALRLAGLFMVYPVFAALRRICPAQRPLLFGMALGAYGLSRVCCRSRMACADRVGRKPIDGFAHLAERMGHNASAVRNAACDIVRWRRGKPPRHSCRGFARRSRRTHQGEFQRDSSISFDGERVLLSYVMRCVRRPATARASGCAAQEDAPEGKPNGRSFIWDNARRAGAFSRPRFPSIVCGRCHRGASVGQPKSVQAENAEPDQNTKHDNQRDKKAIHCDTRIYLKV